ARVLGVRADDAVYIFAPAGLGILVGTILLPRLTERFGKAALSSIGLIAMSLSLAVLSIAPGGSGFLMSTVVPRLIDPGDIPSAISLVSVVMILSLLIGLAFPLINIPAQTLIQERAPVSMRGRIFAIQLTFGNLASVLPLVLIGALADFIGILTVLLIMSLVVLAVGLYSYREAKRIVQNEALAEPASSSDPA
ncbi:MAG: hypothetical protein Q7O66_21950, partial [Dehalococcoidia bacterium]|nr:hypothetical protein [Dehalococcoidia bacterium]